ncbi:hypothetical protein [Streptomyces sp. Ag82_O1-15]|uniref:hypothetical protein n=1 Tax=Streptomyces sp. Ag82_O1-15 TaxID=1938855 RepID=UPI0015CE6999|nr:hypothetical protein [Streptomyces sp. Ag82_O1-15]
MAVGVLGVAVRLGPGAVLFAHWRWIGWVAGLVLAVVLVKTTARTGPACFAVRLRRASKGAAGQGVVEQDVPGLDGGERQGRA